MSGLNEILTALGGEEPKDNLKTTLYEAIIKACGGSVDDLPDRLESTYLKRIAESVGGKVEEYDGTVVIE